MAEQRLSKFWRTRFTMWRVVEENLDDCANIAVCFPRVGISLARQKHRISFFSWSRLIFCLMTASWTSATSRKNRNSPYPRISVFCIARRDPCLFVWFALNNIAWLRAEVWKSNSLLELLQSIVPILAGRGVLRRQQPRLGRYEL